MPADITREHRVATDVWTYKWRCPDAAGKIVRHRLVLGTVKQFQTPDAAMDAFTGVIRAVNSGDVRVQTTTMKVKQLVAHNQQHELSRKDSVSSEHVTGVGEKRYSSLMRCEGASKQCNPKDQTLTVDLYWTFLDP